MSYRVAMEPTHDKNTALFHCRTQLTNLMGESHSLNGGDLSEEEAEFCPVLRLVAELPGVEHITIRPYTMTVAKGALFAWEVLAPQILDLMLAWHFTQCALNGTPDPVEAPLIRIHEGRAYTPRSED